MHPSPRFQPAPPPANASRAAPGAVVYRAAEQSGSDPYEFVMASDDVDRMGDVVNIAGLDLAAFKSNPIALWNHDFSEPIGTWANVRRQAGKLLGRLVLAAEGTSQKVDELRRFLEQRILKTVSVGFRVLEAEPIKGTFGVHFTKSELLECSLVPIPANAAAQRVKALFPAAPSFLFSGAQAAPGSITRTAAQAPPPRRQLAPGQETPAMPRTVAERITAHLTRTASIDDELASINEAADNDNGRDFSDEENERISALSAEKTALVANINTLQEMESAMAARAQSVGAPGGGRAMTVPAQAAKQEAKGAMLMKLASAHALAFNMRMPVETIIAQRYANDDRVAACFDFVKRSATMIADTTTPTWAAELIKTDVAAFIDDFANASVFAALRARASTNSVSLEGIGKLSIPMRNGNGALSGAWVGEAGVIPVLQGTLQSVAIEPTKLAGITTFTRELMNATNDQIESILRIGMREDTAAYLDNSLLDAIPKVAGVRPAGLQVGATVIPSGGADAVNADLGAAVAPIIAAGGGKDIVLIMNPQAAFALSLTQNGLGMPMFPEVQQGRLNRFPIIESANVPPSLVFVMDAAYYVDGAGLPEFAVSEETTLTMANANGTAPTQALDAAGALGTPKQVLPDGGIHVAGTVGAGAAGVQAVSMFQQYSVALRLIVPVHWLMRKSLMVSVITGVGWGGLAFSSETIFDRPDDDGDNGEGNGRRGRISQSGQHPAQTPNPTQHPAPSK